MNPATRGRVRGVYGDPGQLRRKKSRDLCTESREHAKKKQVLNINDNPRGWWLRGREGDGTRGLRRRRKGVLQRASALIGLRCLCTRGSCNGAKAQPQSGKNSRVHVEKKDPSDNHTTTLLAVAPAVALHIPLLLLLPPLKRMSTTHV